MLVLISTLWGSGYLAAEVALADGFGPLWLQGSRLLIASGILAWLARGQGHPFPRRVSVLATGTLAWTVGSGLQTVAQQTVPPGTTALIMGSGPVVSVALGSLLDRRLPSALEGIGLAVGLGGLALLVGPSLGGSAGVPWLLLATVGWSGAAVWEARSGCGAGPLAIAAVQMGIGGIGLTAMALFFAEPLPHLGLAGLAGWGWLTVACAALGMPLWLWILRILPMSVAMLQCTLSPVVAAAGGMVLGETWPAAGKVGMVAVLLGAWLILRGQGAEVEARAVAEA